MNEILVGGIMALLGVVVSEGFSLIRDHLRHKRELLAIKYERRKEIVDRRCEQAESYAQRVTADFRSVMRDAEAFLVRDIPLDAAWREKKRLSWKESLDMEIFSLGPSIRALADKVLWEAWEHMMEVMEKELYEVYGKAWEYRFEGKPVDVESLFERLNEIWLEFSRYVGEFYRRLDQIRLELTEMG